MAVVTAMLSVLLCLLYLRERGINRRINRELMYVKERIGRLTVEEGDGYVLLPSANRGIRELTAQINRLLEDLYLQKEDDRRARLAMMQVLTNISHDLRTPLTVLKGYSELLAGRMRKRDLGSALGPAEGEALAWPPCLSSLPFTRAAWPSSLPPPSPSVVPLFAAVSLP